MRPFLSICIPTFNRIEKLEYNICKLIKLHETCEFEICVSDNASNDGTNEFMLKMVSRYNFIKYNQNSENFGWTYNFDYVLNMANGQYRWLLGDDDEVTEIEQVVETLKEYKPDICVINGSNIIKNMHSKNMYDKNEILSKLGVIMSWISTLIISDLVVKRINIKNVNNNAFPHLIEILKFLDKQCNLYWLNIPAVDTQKSYQNRYRDDIFNYFIRDWYNVTLNIGSYNESSKNEFLNAVIRRAFSLRSIVLLRIENIINRKSCEKVKKELENFPIRFRICIFIIKFIPILFLKNIVRLYKQIKLF